MIRAFANSRIPGLFAVLLAVAGLAAARSATSGAVSQAADPIDLCAKAGTATLTGSISVPIWGFGIPSTPGDCTTADPDLPGPMLSVNKSDTVTVNVENALPTVSDTGDTVNGSPTISNLSSTANLGAGMTVAGAGVPSGATIESVESPTAIVISEAATADGAATPLTFGHRILLEIPGVDLDAGVADADPGETLSETFTASDPGTYLYESSGDAGRQEAMGLYGALIVRSATPQQAYDDASTAYDVEAPLVLSQVDLHFNAVPATFDLKDYLATYWLINGKAYPSTASISATAGQRVLLRYLNAGYDNTAMELLGMHQQVLARDARLLHNPFSANAETIPAGGTEDAIATMPSFAAPNANGFPLFNRNLHVTNGSRADSSYGTPGGMLTFIHP